MTDPSGYTVDLSTGNEAGEPDRRPWITEGFVGTGTLTGEPEEVNPQIISTTIAEGHMDPETGEPVIDKRCSCTTIEEGPGAGFIVADVDPACLIHGDTGEGPIGGTYTVGGATFDHLGNKLGPPYPLGSPELREHVAYMVQQCEFARGLSPLQRALWTGNAEEAGRLMLAEIDNHTEETP